MIAPQNTRPDFYRALLVALPIIGYETVALIVSFAGVDSRNVTIPYRAVVATFCAIVILYCLATNRKAKFSPWIASFFIIYIIRLLIDLGSGLSYAPFAIQFFIGAVAIPAVASTLIFPALKTDRFLGLAVITLGSAFLVMCVIALFSGLRSTTWASGEDGRLGFSALNPISLGHGAAAIALASLYLFLTQRVSLWIKGLCAALVVGSLFLLADANSRGPTIGFILAGAWFTARYIKRLRAMAPFVILPILAFVAGLPALDHTLATLSGGWRIDRSSLGRLEIQSHALQDFYDHPLFGKHFIDPAFGATGYPHNVIIESAMALGIIGPAALGGMIIFAMYKIQKYFGKAHPLVVMLFLQQLVNSQLSGAIWNSVPFFALLSIILSSQDPKEAARSDRPRPRPVRLRA